MNNKKLKNLAGIIGCISIVLGIVFIIAGLDVIIVERTAYSLNQLDAWSNLVEVVFLGAITVCLLVIIQKDKQ